MCRGFRFTIMWPHKELLELFVSEGAKVFTQLQDLVCSVPCRAPHSAHDPCRRVLLQGSQLRCSTIALMLASVLLCLKYAHGAGE